MSLNTSASLHSFAFPLSVPTRKLFSPFVFLSRKKFPVADMFINVYLQGFYFGYFQFLSRDLIILRWRYDPAISTIITIFRYKGTNCSPAPSDAWPNLPCQTVSAGDGNEENTGCRHNLRPFSLPAVLVVRSSLLCLRFSLIQDQGQRTRQPDDDQVRSPRQHNDAAGDGNPLIYARPFLLIPRARLAPWAPE